MKSVVYNKFGDAGVFELINSKIPEVSGNKVLVKTAFVSLNPVDWKVRKGEFKFLSGSTFPKGTGCDFSGVIVKADQGSEFKEGDEVFGCCNAFAANAMSEYIAIDKSLVHKVPTGLSLAKATSLPVVTATALLALEDIAKVKAGDKVLINGCTGGVGMIAVQLAKSKGAIVTGVCSGNSAPYATKWGVNRVIDYTKENIFQVAGEKYDVVLELSGKWTYPDALPLLADKSFFLNPTPGLNDVFIGGLRNFFSSQQVRPVFSTPNDKATLKRVFDFVSAYPQLEVEISKSFPIEQFREAYEYAERGKFIGKVVVEFK